MPPWRLARHFLGSPASVTEARRFITIFLSQWTIVEAAELIVSELATNAVRHTASGRFGGRFLVSIQAEPDQVWLGVIDEGGPFAPTVMPASDEEGGRGLLLVSCLADSWGVYGDETGRTVWALLKVDPIVSSRRAAVRR
ncbi:ATP-binding protein [Microbispora sp. NPDC049125]|uniref:ATP-binding protein n=1 Tax=Microbispora sp. NPDC049125 TaxID=3154929 RepID=UPI00346600AF